MTCCCARRSAASIRAPSTTRWRIVFSLPMYHVYGYVEGMLTVPFVGGAIIPQLQFDPAATLTAIERTARTTSCWCRR